MKRSTPRLFFNVWLLACLTMVASVGGEITQTQDPAGPFSGRATVVRAKVLTLQEIVLADTGELPASGGAAEDSLLEADVSPDQTGEVLGLGVKVLSASTVGQGNQSSSEASVADVNMTVGGNTISAGLLRAEATARCQGASAQLSGRSQILNLVINGMSIKVETPNQRIALPNGFVILNEQKSNTTGNSGEITVSALHVVVGDSLTGNIADVTISSAHADITCPVPPACPNPNDFVTGGGWITASGGKANFGVAGGLKNGALWGHLVYIDHGAGLKVKGTAVTNYEIVPGTTTRHITGSAEIDGSSGTYDVLVTDNGEPGRDDTFNISLSTRYTAAGTLGGGNIQLHKPCK